MQIALEYTIKALVKEAFLHRNAIVVMFAAITMTALWLGLLWPKQYSSSTIIIVDEKNIIQPLMQGAAVATEVVDRGRIAREVIYSRKIMDQVLEFGGWMASKPSDAEQDRLVKQVLIPRTTITNVGRNLIKIEYNDSDPTRAFQITQKIAELFISESLEAKARESQAAYAFIDKQVQEYHEKLTKAEADLKEFRSANMDARPGTDAEIGTRINTTQTRIEQTAEELKEAEIRTESLEKQLSGEVETTAAFSREGQYRTRIAELQTQLDALRLTYHDGYPDIVRLRHQIEDLNQSIAAEKARRESGRGGKPVVDETVMLNPLYQQLRRDLLQSRTNVDTLKARLAEARRQLQTELARGRRVHGGEATLAELTRDYEVNRDIYQDLLRRRENARVSMNLDLEKQGLIFRIHEPALLSHNPTGVRFLHFVLAGLVLGIAVPFGFVYAKHRFDPRVRFEPIITDKLKLPLFAVVPHMNTPLETAGIARNLRYLALALVLNLGVFGTLTALKLAGVI